MSFGDARVQRFAPAGLGQTKIHNRDWSGESVLHWAANPDLIALIGVSYRAASADQLIDLSQLSGIGRFKDKQDAFGIFGEVTWTLLPRLELTGGLRFQRDGQTRDGALAADDGPIDLDYDRAFHAWLPKVSLAYDLSGGVRVGALVQKAYNPGGVTLRFDTGAPDPFDAETLWDYELFARVSSASGRLSARANLFYYDIENAQRARSIVITAPTDRSLPLPTCSTYQRHAPGALS
jgi:outer membrane receptor protein involved in Fe transport